MYAAKSCTNRSIADGLVFVLFCVGFLVTEGFRGEEEEVEEVVVVFVVGARVDLVEKVLFFVLGRSGFCCENTLLKLSALLSFEVAWGGLVEEVNGFGTGFGFVD